MRNWRLELIEMYDEMFSTFHENYTVFDIIVSDRLIAHVEKEHTRRLLYYA